jgi:hypothetical protein
VRAQGLVAHLEEVAGRHVGGRRVGAVLHPLERALQFFEQGGLGVGAVQLVDVGLHARVVEDAVVVELRHLPRLAQLGVERRVGGGLDGGDRDLVGANVIGMRVAAVLVIGHENLRLELPNELDERLA